MLSRFFATTSALVFTLATGTALAWPGTEVFPGVTYEHRSGLQDYGSGAYAQEIYITYVDTAHPSVSFVATRSADRGSVVSSWAGSVGASVAINTNFYGGGHQPCGMVMGEGELWTDAYQGSVEGSCSHSVAIGPGNEVSFPYTWGMANGPAPAGAHDVATGMPTIVRDGVVVDQAEIESSAYPDHMATAQPRTAVCIHEDGHTMIFAVVDGREPDVRVGMRGITLARFMKSLGCYRAINLDGGGSSTMFIEGQTPYPGRPTGVVNRTSDGQERAVCCQLGVRIDPDAPPQDAGLEAGEDAAIEAGTDAELDATPDVQGDSSEASDTGAAPDAADSAAGDAAAGGASWGGGDEASGCACRASGATPSWATAWLLGIAAVVWVLQRQRRKSIGDA